MDTPSIRSLPLPLPLDLTVVVNDDNDGKENLLEAKRSDHVNNFNNLNSSIYSNSSERNDPSVNKQVTQRSEISTVPQKQQEVGDKNIFSRAFSSIKNFFFGEPNKNSDVLTPNKAWAIIENDTINGEKKIHALDFLANASTSRNIFFQIFYGKEKRIQGFCSNFIKNITDTNSLLHLRKMIFRFAAASTTKNPTDRHLFVNILIKEIDNAIDKNLNKYAKDKAENISKIGGPAQSIKIYTEALSYIKSIKSDMPTVIQPLTNDQIKRESIVFLKESENNIYKNLSKHIKNKFKYALMVGDQEQLKKLKELHEEMLFYAASIKELLIEAQSLTQGEIKQEGIDFVMKALVELCHETNFIYAKMIEKLILKDEEGLRFSKLIEKEIKQHNDCIYKNGYDEGYKNGYDKGHRDGYVIGYWSAPRD